MHNGRKKETIPPNNFIYICVLLWVLIRRLIDGCVLKVVHHHHQYSYCEAVVTSRQPIYSELLFLLRCDTKESARI